MTTEEKWRARVDEWRASGQGAREFCAAQGCSESSLYSWAQRLGGKAGSVPLARVVARPTMLGGDTPLVIEAAGARVTVRRGVDRDLLRDVLAALWGGAR